MAQATAEIWERALERLRSLLGEDEYKAWLEPIRFESWAENERAAVLSVHSDFYHRWISRKYMEQIRAAIADATSGDEPDVRLVVITPEEASEAADSGTPAITRGTEPAPPVSTPPRQAGPWDSGNGASPAAPAVHTRPHLSSKYTFDDFVVGESNRYAHAAAQSVADPNSNAFNPLFLYGPSGLGKTHLMQAIGHHFLKQRPDAQILYVTSEHFINSFIDSIQNSKSANFRQRYREVDMLLLDDVQFLMGKERTQQEVFHTFNSLFDEGKKIVLTSDRPPKDLQTLEDRLKSRFEWGVIADLQPPDLETRIAILRQKARNEGMKVPPDVISYIAEWIRTNVREMEGALKRIKVYASLHSCPVSMDVAREVLSHLIVGQPQNRVSIEDIQRHVCEYFEITTPQLLGSNRSKKFSQPRHLALYLCREMTDLSFPDIAQKFGGKDHTSVIYACRKIKKAVETDPNMASIVEYLTRQIQSGRGE